MGLAGFADHFDEEVRLTILKALAEQNDYRLPDSMLLTVLDSFGINRGRDHLRSQLNFLQDQVSAVTLVAAGTAVIATLTETGLDHVERRRILSGVKRPSLRSEG
ncbi:MAG: hypothetical protein AAF739_03245 [Pseudomonadota bacterium]